MFLLRCGSREIPLPQGGCLIGRGADCQVVIDDALASRRHAFIKLTGDKVTIQDLGSRNGVYLNGERVVGAMALTVGDEVIVGQTQLSLVEGLGESVRPEVARPSVRSAKEAPAQQAGDLQEGAGGRLDVTAHADLLGLLGTVADKAIAQGRPETAERLLTRHLSQLLTASKQGRLSDGTELELAAVNALKLAVANNKAQWAEYIFELYGGARRVLPAPIIDGLNEAIRKLPPVSLAVVQQYVEGLRRRVSELSSSERFLLQRVEGLERVAAAR